MTAWTVDVTFSTSFPVKAHGDDWHRVVVESPNATEAELAACQMVQSHPGQTAVASVVVDWL